MITNETVFILGAGASAPYGYPTGDALLERMASEVGNSMELGSLARFKNLPPHETNQLINLGYSFKTALQAAQPKSIDSFLEKRLDFSELGKYFIAKIIATDESTHLHRITNIEANLHWMKYLKNIIINKPYEEIIKSKVTFITFNYDMSLEKYFLEALIATFNISIPREFFDSIKILHIHGRIKKLPWEKCDLISLDRGTPNDVESVVKMSQGIQLVHEELAESETLKEARNALSKAQTIFILGCGYHRQNFVKLGLQHFSAPPHFGHSCYGTILGMSNGEAARARTELRFSQHVTLVDTDCCGLLKIHNHILQ